MKHSIIALAAVAVLLVLSLPAAASTTSTQDVGLGVLYDGFQGGQSHARLLVRNMGSGSSDPLRMIIYKSNFGVSSSPGMKLKLYNIEQYTKKPFNVPGTQTRQFPVIAYSPYAVYKYCFGANLVDVRTTTSVNMTTCSDRGKPMLLTMYVTFPRAGSSSDLKVVVHNYGRTKSKPFYIWLWQEGWTKAFAGVPAGKDRVLQLHETPGNGSYVLKLAFAPVLRAPFSDLELQQGES